LQFWSFVIVINFKSVRVVPVPAAVAGQGGAPNAGCQTGGRSLDGVGGNQNGQSARALL